jgi:hypothetical protein
VDPHITSPLAFDYQELHLGYDYHRTWDPEDTRVSLNYTNTFGNWLPANNQGQKQGLNRYKTRQSNPTK